MINTKHANLVFGTSSLSLDIYIYITRMTWARKLDRKRSDWREEWSKIYHRIGKFNRWYLDMCPHMVISHSFCDNRLFSESRSITGTSKGLTRFQGVSFPARDTLEAVDPSIMSLHELCAANSQTWNNTQREQPTTEFNLPCRVSRRKWLIGLSCFPDVVREGRRTSERGMSGQSTSAFWNIFGVIMRLFSYCTLHENRVKSTRQTCRPSCSPPTRFQAFEVAPSKSSECRHKGLLEW